ncbi:hypothetical protein BDR06DRAFT_967445 [Suillus hirtellus]|nr:hypothetical protein BDR06DRAFT_967445 [Suillus hirtellus]
MTLLCHGRKHFMSACVGHSVALWRVIRGCLGLQSTTTVNSGGMDVDQGQDDVGEEVSNDESDEEKFDLGDHQDLGDGFDVEMLKEVLMTSLFKIILTVMIAGVTLQSAKLMSLLVDPLTA